MDIKRFLFSIFFPNKCVFCNKVISVDAVHCENCIKNISMIPYDVCHSCFKPNCICESKPYIRLITVYRYDNYTKNSIFNLKFNGVRKHSYFLALQIFDYIKTLSLNDKIDCVIPVPMHKKAKRMRGYNQSTILSNHIAYMLNAPISTDVLFKQKHTKKQHDLGYKMRQTNLVGAYAVQNSQKLKGKTVLLVDDVYTTGNTILQCCSVLQAAGIKKIYVATLLNAH